MANDDRIKKDWNISAADRLFSAHWTEAWQAAYRIVGRRDLADDIAQEALIAAIGRLDDYRGEAPIEAWIRRIVINGAVDALRREQREDRKYEPPSIAADAEATTSADIVAAVRQVPLQRRLPVILRYWLDCTPTEIGELLGIPVGTVNSRIARGLSELREQLEVRHV
jgi:RNA polymerase sigma-70 factor, ECF subfamily